MGDSFQFVWGLNSRDFTNFEEDDSDEILGGPLDKILVYGNQLFLWRHSLGAPDRLAVFLFEKWKENSFIHASRIDFLPSSTLDSEILYFSLEIW